MSTDLQERDARLRQLLVATATASTGTQPRNSGRRVMVTSVAAFVVAGVLTGGAVSAAALGFPTPPPPPATVNVEAMAQDSVYDGTELFGTPVLLSGQGDTTIILGDSPEGATGLFIVFNCLDPGPFVTLIDGEFASRTTCDEESTGRAGSGGFQAIDGASGKSHRLQIEADPSQRFAIWASWATPATYSSSTAQQQALLDGEVTEQEYRDEFGRYQQCMADAGYPLGSVNDAGVIITYVNSGESVQSGVEGRCYATEFRELDAAWQANQER